ncbi:18093_t:CDS:1, partial [Acaulospora morrowiae]
CLLSANRKTTSLLCNILKFFFTKTSNGINRLLGKHTILREPTRINVDYRLKLLLDLKGLLVIGGIPVYAEL